MIRSPGLSHGTAFALPHPAALALPFIGMCDTLSRQLSRRHSYLEIAYENWETAMKASLRIGTVAGTGVFLHWSFLLLFGWLFVMQAVESGLTAALETGLFIGAVFLCVTLHEIGHVTMAQRFGIRTQDITLLPIGGVARLAHIPEEPHKELLIALAGPAVNIVIATGLYIGMTISGLTVTPIEGALVEASFLTSMFWFNVIVVAFNMLPAFPMDGGRVFRALLAQRRDYVEATQSAARAGQAIAVLFVLFGLAGNWLLALVGVFVFLGALSESKAVEVRSITTGATVSDAMLTNYLTLDGQHQLEDAVDALLTTTQTSFPVRLSNGATGLLTRPKLLSALKFRGPLERLDDVITQPAPTVSASLDLFQAMGKLAEVRGPMIVVNLHGEPIGLLTLGNLQEWIQVETALRSRTRPDRIRQRNDSPCPAFDDPILERFAGQNRFTTPMR